MMCGRCKAEIEPGEEEYCWFCMGPLCYECWDEKGHCGHARADEINEEGRKRGDEGIMKNYYDDEITPDQLCREEPCWAANRIRQLEAMNEKLMEESSGLNFVEDREMRLFKDGDQWCAVFGDFVNLQESQAGFGTTVFGALVELARVEAEIKRKRR